MAHTTQVRSGPLSPSDSACLAWRVGRLENRPVDWFVHGVAGTLSYITPVDGDVGFLSICARFRLLLTTPY